MTNLPPTEQAVMQSQDPTWLRSQADAVEEQAHVLAEQLRTRADSFEFRVKMAELNREQANTHKALGASEIRLRQLREAQ